MTFGGFLFGLVIFAIGFAAVWKTTWFLQNLGDIGTMIGVYNMPWLSWKTFGIILMVLGFLFAFGLFGIFFSLFFGRLFSFGSLR